MDWSIPTRLILLALAGAAGTLARFGVYEACARTPLRDLPAATFIVNVLGSFLFGLIWAMCDQGRISTHTRLLLLGGFMGAFTTFSTLAFDTGDLIARTHYLAAAANIAASNILGVAAFFLGLWVATPVARLF